MGIRYFGLAFDAALSDIGRDDPGQILRHDPWDGPAGIGCPPHCEHDPEDWRDTCRGELHLERAWIDLQRLTRPADGDVARPAYRMFEGNVSFDAGLGATPWVRAILPDDVIAIRDDLRLLISGFTTALRTGCEDYLQLSPRWWCSAVAEIVPDRSNRRVRPVFDDDSETCESQRPRLAPTRHSETVVGTSISS